MNIAVRIRSRFCDCPVAMAWCLDPRYVADKFNNKHPARHGLTCSTFGKVLNTFKEIGSTVVYKACSGRPRASEEG
jgi:hypothetical protein